MCLQTLKRLINPCCLHPRILCKDRRTLGKVYQTKGEFGKIAQFWLNCLNLMRLQHQAHTAIQTNDFEIHLDAWERVLPYYLIFSKMNYVQYGSYCVQVLKQIESILD